MRRLLIGSVVVTALASCGSSDKTPTSDPPSASLTPYKGIYVAKINKSDLVREGAAGPDARSGNWTLTIAQTDPAAVRVEPGGFDLKATRMSNGQVTFGPDPSCPDRAGRTKPSVFKIEKTSVGVRFTAVSRGCRPDAAPLILGHWFKT